MSRYTPAKENAQKIRQDLKAELPGLKFSVKSDHNSIGIALMRAPKSVFVSGLPDAGYRQVNPYAVGESPVLNEYGKKIFKAVNEIVKRYHWDDSRAEVDYFSCAFYFNFAVGRWDKTFGVK